MALTFGRVIEEQKNYCLVDISREKPVRAVLKGAAKNKQKRVAVGDFVEVQTFDGIADNAIIRNVAERKNYLSKPLIANIDEVFFINCLVEPALDLAYIDKFLFCAAVRNISVTLVLNKTDLLTRDQAKELQTIAEIYRNVGYSVLLASINDENSIARIFDAAVGKVSVFAGQSGVGKSSVMQILFPDVYFAVQELSASLHRGKNTTSHTSLLPLPKSRGGGFVADTPGFSVFETPYVQPQFVASFFPEFVRVLEEKPCKFSNCSHKNEPNCSVLKALEDEKIARSRYQNFLSIFDEMSAKKITFL